MFLSILQLKKAGGLSFGKENQRRVWILFCRVRSIKRYLGSYSCNFLCLDLQIRSLISPCHCCFSIFHLQHFLRKEAAVSSPAWPDTMTLGHEQTESALQFCLKSACAGDNGNIFSCSFSLSLSSGFRGTFFW